MTETVDSVWTRRDAENKAIKDYAFEGVIYLLIVITSNWLIEDGFIIMLIAVPFSLAMVYSLYRTLRIVFLAGVGVGILITTFLLMFLSLTFLFLLGISEQPNSNRAIPQSGGHFQSANAKETSPKELDELMEDW